MKITKIAFVFLAMIALSTSFAMWKQCDPRWGGNLLGWGPDTICGAGCLMTSATMAITSLPAWQNPATVNQWLKATGGYVDGDNFVWAAIQPFGLSFNGLSTNVLGIGVHLSVGHFIIANVLGGQHWVLATAASNGWMSVNDPGFDTDGYRVVDVVQYGIYARTRLPVKLGSYLTTLEEVLGLRQKHQEMTKMIAHKHDQQVQEEVHEEAQEIKAI